MLKVVDPHIHLWDLRTGLYPHFEAPAPGADNAAICRNYLLPEYLVEGGAEVDVVGAVHVEAFPTNPVGEADMVQKVADGAALPLVLVGNADLRAANLVETLDRLGDFSVFRGIRQIINGPKVNEGFGLENDPAFLAGLQELGRRGLSFDLQLWPAQMHRASELAASAPDTLFIVNHAGLWTGTSREGWKQWREGLQRLAACDNVRIKISGLGMFDPGWSRNGIAPVIFEVLEAFGTQRTMFASNFPVDKLNATFVTIWNTFASLSEDLSHTERDALFRQNAIDTYRIPVAATL